MIETEIGDTQFKPYRVVDTGRSVDEVFATVNTAVWDNYGPDYSNFGDHKPVAAPLQNFVQLLEELTAIPDVRFIDHVALSTSRPQPGELRVAFRHDIDTDIVGAVAQAEAEAAFGIRANWLVLHTAPYYGEVDPETGLFMRNDSMVEIYRRFQDLGHEVSLHIDPLMLYQDHGIDGSQALVTELEWMRSHGIEIRGTTAHNFRPRYGAENYEIFKGVQSPGDDAASIDARWVEHEGKTAALRVLDEDALGLVYEGNQVFWHEDRDVAFASVGAFDQWFFGDGRGSIRRFQQLDRTQLVHEIRTLGPGSDVVVVVHPEYLAVREGPGLAPKRRIDIAEIAPSPLGWNAYAPDTIVAVPVTAAARTGSDAEPGPSSDSVATIGQQFTQGCHLANDWGMIDRPVAQSVDVLIVGSDNVNGRAVPMESQVHRRLAEFAAKQSDSELTVAKIAHPAMGIDRLWSWISIAVDALGPRLIALGVPLAAPGNVGLDRWPAPSGRGKYLSIGQRGKIKEFSFPRQRKGLPNDTDSLLRLYEWVIAELVKRDITTVLFVESPPATGSSADNYLERLSELTARLNAAVVDPTQLIADEHAKFGLDPTGLEWDANAHRVAAEALLPVILPRLGISVTSTRTEPTATIERRPHPIDIETATAARRAVGLLDYPVPFAAARALINAKPGLTTDAHDRLIEHAVHRLGVDFGQGIPLAAHHQRYSGGRKGLATTERAILTHDLRRDNAPTQRTASWAAKVFNGVHTGNVDYLHGISAWGVRSLAFHIEASDTGAALISPFHGRDEEKVPHALNASNFPVAAIAIETTATTVPDGIVPADGSDPYVLVSTRPVGGGCNLAVYRREPTLGNAPLDVIVPGSSPLGVPRQTELPAFLIDLAPVELLSAAMHNTDAAGITTALDGLSSRYRVGVEVNVARDDYSFYSRDGLAAASGRLSRVLDRRSGAPVALFANPSDAGQAALAVADDPRCAAYLSEALDRAGTRFTAPYRGRETSTVSTDPADPTELVRSVTDRSGNVRLVLSPQPANAAGSKLHGTELVSITDDEGSDGSAGDELGLLSDLAERHFGPVASERVWFTRPSVLATYSNTLAQLATTTTRQIDKSGIDQIAISNPDTVREVPSGALPITVTDLFGVSFGAAQVATTDVALDGRPVTPLIRWVDREAITIAACGIRWPVISTVDPASVASYAGDIDKVTVDGQWAWHSATDAAPGFGRLTVTDGSPARLRIGLDRLNPIGAQIIVSTLRADPGTRVAVRCITEGGGVFEMTSTPQADLAPGTAQFAIQPTATWDTHAAPTWGFTSAAALPHGRTIRAVEIVVDGPTGTSVDIGSLWLGRPRSDRTEPGVLPVLGGDALGREVVVIETLDGAERHECPVDLDGLFVSPGLNPGLYLAAADGDSPVAIQLDSTRFDLDLKPRS